MPQASVEHGIAGPEQRTRGRGRVTGQREGSPVGLPSGPSMTSAEPATLATNGNRNLSHPFSRRGTADTSTGSAQSTWANSRPRVLAQLKDTYSVYKLAAPKLQGLGRFRKDRLETRYDASGNQLLRKVNINSEPPPPEANGNVSGSNDTSQSGRG